MILLMKSSEIRGIFVFRHVKMLVSSIFMQKIHQNVQFYWSIMIVVVTLKKNEMSQLFHFKLHVLPKSYDSKINLAY